MDDDDVADDLEFDRRDASLQRLLEFWVQITVLVGVMGALQLLTGGAWLVAF
ncbi:hypothetical protein I0C86_40650 [Plantactinospora sp. S1510]|uniref:Uncharacterized protein n=1 Tax=Plantactinospora alkalitolerans TaxID=2789879 RepID=A0ABS0H9P7_9ACTN|nr:hypothetical protein [Plantactinospora alkalitolerans]MBF9135191.1 hypothetical protein [Plantactinospora alkalitolerans]